MEEPSMAAQQMKDSCAKIDSALDALERKILGLLQIRTGTRDLADKMEAIASVLSAGMLTEKAPAIPAGTSPSASTVAAAAAPSAPPTAVTEASTDVPALYSSGAPTAISAAWAPLFIAPPPAVAAALVQESVVTAAALPPEVTAAPIQAAPSPVQAYAPVARRIVPVAQPRLLRPGRHEYRRLPRRRAWQRTRPCPRPQPRVSMGPSWKPYAANKLCVPSAVNHTRVMRTFPPWGRVGSCCHPHRTALHRRWRRPGAVLGLPWSLHRSRICHHRRGLAPHGMESAIPNRLCVWSQAAIFVSLSMFDDGWSHSLLDIVFRGHVKSKFLLYCNSTTAVLFTEGVLHLGNFGDSNFGAKPEASGSKLLTRVQISEVGNVWTACWEFMSSSCLSLAASSSFIKDPDDAATDIVYIFSKAGGYSVFLGKLIINECNYILMDIMKQHCIQVAEFLSDHHGDTVLAFLQVIYNSFPMDKISTDSSRTSCLAGRGEVVKYLSEDEWILDPVIIADIYEPLGLDFIVDGGVRIADPSTVVDMTGTYPTIIRQGKGPKLDWMVTEEDTEQEGESMLAFKAV
ncbi:hypothetical protein EJB05_48086, partial [Eragrostis curvula]